VDDLRSRLERLGRRAQPSSDAFERLTRTRLRRERKRRIVAGGVALLVALAGSIGVFALVDDDSRVGGVGGSNGDGFFALWPDQTAEGLAAAAERVAAGDPGSAWRTDPIETARRFALEELRWPAVEIEVPEGTDLEADVMILDLGVPFEASCDGLVADARCPTTRTTVAMRRQASGDPWVVESVHGEELILPLAPGDVVSSGTWIRVPTRLPDGAKVSMGLALLSTCHAAGVDDNVVASGGVLEFYVPAVPEACTGYVYAMLPPTGVGAVAIGSFLFTDAEDVPAIGYLVDQVAAVPVRFVNDAPTEVAEFICDETGMISPSVSGVIAQPDGVHVAITNTGDVGVSFSVELGGDGAEPGERTETVWQLPPGETQVTCSVIVEGGPGVASSASLNVVDPSGYYVPTHLDCAGGEAYGEAPAYAEGATGVVGDPVQVVKDHVSGLEFDDAVERAAYPESVEPVVRIVREGATVGLITLFDDGQGGWLVNSIEGCSGTQFGWSDEPTGVTGPPGPSSDWQELCAEAYAGTGDNIHRGADLHVDGVDVAFDTRCLVAPAGEPLTILFSNLDEAIQRNISVYAMTPCLRERTIEQRSPGGCLSVQAPERRFAGEIVTGVSEIVYRLGPLEPGEYYFQDDVHPSANGVLIVE
jgi:hypothetical protein